MTTALATRQIMVVTSFGYPRPWLPQYYLAGIADDPRSTRCYDLDRATEVVAFWAGTRRDAALGLAQMAEARGIHVTMFDADGRIVDVPLPDEVTL